MERLNGLFVLSRDVYDVVYAPAAAGRIAGLVDLVAPPQTAATVRADPGLLADVDVIFSGWGMPRLDAALLGHAPRLKAVFYAAGATNGWATPTVWDREIVVTTANDANAIPVAEYTTAMILLALKHGLRLACGPRRAEGFRLRPELPGNYHAKVGLIGMGTIGRRVAAAVRHFGIHTLTYDPYLTAADADRLGVTKVGLDALFDASDVLSLHAPDLPSTRHLIGRDLLARMRPGATFINTARGRVVSEVDLVSVLRERPDLHAVLDVTEHEPLPADSPLLALDNLTLTPHIAGSQGRECQRMGDYMADELERYLAGEPLWWQVQPTTFGQSVHGNGQSSPRPLPQTA